MVTHLNYIRETAPDNFRTGTVCGLSNAQSKDGTNSASDHSEVTCKKCLAIMSNPRHWAHRKYILKEKR